MQATLAGDEDAIELSEKSEQLGTTGDNSQTEKEAPVQEATRSNPHEFVFPKIIDVFAEIQSGNFLPLFKFLKRCQSDPTLDPYIYNTQGFNLFHMVIASANFEFVKVILDNFPDFINRKTRHGQTNLMIALNQKNFDVIRLILELERTPLDYTDDSGFDIFMYLVRNNSIVLFFFFLKRYLQELYRKEAARAEGTPSQSEDGSRPTEEFGLGETLGFSGLNKSKVTPIFKDSIFSLKNRDKNGCTLVHWAAFRDCEFLLKFLVRMGCDLSKKDFQGHLPLEKGTENNAVRAVHFLDSYSRYPFQTSYFLTGRFNPVEFDYLPANYTKIDTDYESEVLKESFEWKKMGLRSYSYKKLRYLWAKSNLKYRFGLMTYFLWVAVSVASFCSQMAFDGVAVRVFALTMLLLACLSALLLHLFSNQTQLHLAKTAWPGDLHRPFLRHRVLPQRRRGRRAPLRPRDQLLHPDGAVLGGLTSATSPTSTWTDSASRKRWKSTSRKTTASSSTPNSTRATFVRCVSSGSPPKPAT